MKKSPNTPLLTRFTQLFRKTGGEDVSSRTQNTEAPQTTAESLKGHFKQKRRNDAIRAREFNQLRKTIKFSREIHIHETLNLPAQNSPVRATTTSSQLQRKASILDKIDGAEAHLEQWWGSSSSHATLTSQAEPRDIAPAQSDPDDDLDLDFTDMQGLSVDNDTDLAPMDASLRDAALLYAEGEFEAAQAALLNLLDDPAQDEDTSELLTASLFDVYRCSGQQERFDALALDYANRFGRSPPEWFSLADTESQAASANQNDAATKPQSGHLTLWVCPAILDAKALGEYVDQTQTSEPSCSINWLALQHIDSAISVQFGRLVTHWCQSPIELQWLGTGALLSALQMCRVSGDEAINQPWWLIQLDVLRLLKQETAFEDLALEYCVTYEVSPPSWSAVMSRFGNIDETPQHQEFASTVPSVNFDEVRTEPGFSVFELTGNITGDNPQMLAQLRASSAHVDRITISCTRVGRIDLNAAATLMSWVRDCHMKGHQVQFIHLPRLILVYFNMLGMETFAGLSTGKC